MVQGINPLDDLRWSEFVQHHLDSSVFHTVGWLKALKIAYGFEPVVYTCSPMTARLDSALVFCNVSSWLTGNRAVSLPFSDHCSPLGSASDMLEICAKMRREQRTKGWDYVELRPRGAIDCAGGFVESNKYWLHRLDISAPLELLFHRFHKSCTQRKIFRAAREELTYEEGHSELLLRKFYHLHIRTRRRRCLPVQPLRWFRTLVECMGPSIKIHVASKSEVPVASIVTLSFRNTVVYKYGATDENSFRLGGIQSLIWKAIIDARKNGMTEIDFGRSDIADDGLVKFKDRFGAMRHLMTYFRSGATDSAKGCSFGFRQSIVSDCFQRAAKPINSFVPSTLLSWTGRILYRHFA